MSTAELARKGEMSIMNETGDTKLSWSSNRPKEVEVARATFKRMRKKGYLAYSVKRRGDRGEVITEFDKNLEKIILAPPVIGG